MSDYKLYYMNGACSMAVHVLLTELGQSFELIKGRDASGAKTAELMAANPRGVVPTLTVPQGFTIREGAAIISWLCDTHPSALWPTDAQARAAAQEWLAFANSTVHPAYSTAMMLKRAHAPEALQQAQQEKIQNLWADVEQQLAKTTYVAGNNITPADILLTVIANWQAYISAPVTFGPNCKRLFSAVTARPSYQAALATEGVTYQAAA